MTIAPSLVNSGADFIAGAILPSAEVNKEIHNGYTAIFSAASAMSRASVWNGSVAPREHNGQITAVSNDVTIGTIDQLYFGLNGDVANLSMSSSGSETLSPGSFVFCPIQSRWYVFCGESTKYLYGLNTMASLQEGSTSFTSAFRVRDSTLCGDSLARVLVCGDISAGSTGKIGRINNDIASIVYTGGAGESFRSIAASSDGTYAVCAGFSTAVSSSNGGVNWSAITLPTLPSKIGWLTVSYCAGVGFIISGLTTTGQMFWSTSITGSSWQSWKKTSQVAVAPTANVYDLRCGICAIGSSGNVLVCPHVTKQLNNQDIVGALISIDGGASWVTFSGGVTFPSCENLRAIPVGNRAAITSSYGFTVTPELIISNPVSSVLA